jgi:hypothetical protein
MHSNSSEWPLRGVCWSVPELTQAAQPERETHVVGAQGPRRI